MSQQLSPLAIIEINAILPSGNEQCKDVCKEWRDLWRRYFVGGHPSRLHKASFANRDEYALAHGRMTKTEAIQMIFASGEPVTLCGTMPKWLIPTVVEKFISLRDVVPSSMRIVCAEDVWGLTVNDVWNEIFYSQFQCPNCSNLCDSEEDLQTTFHVSHPTCTDWCLTLRFYLWDKETDVLSQNFEDVGLFVQQFLCHPEPVLPHSNKQSLRLAELHNEVFHWLSRADVDKSQLICKAWHVGIDWQWRSLPLHSGKITIESVHEVEQASNR